MSAMNTLELWVELTTHHKLIAGPWVPRQGVMLRFNIHYEPIAMACCQADIEPEDARLEKLGYDLTDKNRIVPDRMWNEILDGPKE